MTMRQQIRLGLRRIYLKLPPGVTLILMVLAASTASGQTAGEAAPQAASASSHPVTITLDEAIQRAQANEPTYAAASAASRISALDRSIARAGLLPSVNYHNQILYTQPNGLLNQAGQGVAAQPAPRSSPTTRFVSMPARQW